MMSSYIMKGKKGQIATDHDSSSSDYAVKSVVLI